MQDASKDYDDTTEYGDSWWSTLPKDEEPYNSAAWIVVVETEVIEE